LATTDSKIIIFFLKDDSKIIIILQVCALPNF